MVEERFFTMAEVALKLNVSLRLVQQWVKDGKIAHYELTSGKRKVKRIPESILDKMLAKRLKPRTRRI